jgi:hypothetical protein
MKTFACAFLLSLAFLSKPETGICAQQDSKIVTRIETVKAQMKGRKLVIRVVGMGRTPALIRGSGQLSRRGPDHKPNSDGLLEYDLYFNPPPNYSGYTLKSVKATLKESSVPAGVTGVRVFGEFNQIDAMLPQKKAKKEKKKKEKN